MCKGFGKCGFFSYLCAVKRKNFYILVAVVVALLVVSAWLAMGPMHREAAKVWRYVTGDTTPPPPLNVEVPRSQYPVKGIDISHHNGVIDFAKVAADSVDFVVIKATDGVNFTDSCMMQNYQGARANGLKTGFYHFFRFNRGGVRQGRHFLHTIAGLDHEFPAMIDFESENNANIDYYLVVGRLRDMIGYLRARKIPIMIYCNHKDFDYYIRDNFPNVDLWMASGRKPDGDDDDMPRRVLWQHSHNGRVRGISKPVDINTFNGTRAQYHEWLNSLDSDPATQ